MNRRRLLALTGTLLAGALAGCSAPKPESSDRQSAMPGVEPDVGGEAIETLVGGANDLAIALYDQLRTESASNLLASPVSITTALAMAYAGARGETRSQMRESLHYRLDDQTLHSAFNGLQRELNARGEAVDPEDLPSNYEAEDDPVPFQLSLINAVWGQTGYPFEEDYLDVLSDHYGGGLREVDYSAEPAAARTTINDWVKEQTADRIEDLLPAGSLDVYTRLVLTNAVYFKANWHNPFQSEATQPAPFTPVTGSDVDVPMMNQQVTVPYAEFDGVQAVDLPYVGQDVSMLVILPPTGKFETFERSLSAETVSNIHDGLERREGSITLPKFEFESEFGLRQTLETLGMPIAFERREADFSGIADIEATGENLYIHDVYHDTYIAVDEQGTEAAAATGVVIKTESAPADPFEFVADRPFLFAIRDRPTGAILFLGRVVDAGAAQ